MLRTLLDYGVRLAHSTLNILAGSLGASYRVGTELPKVIWDKYGSDGIGDSLSVSLEEDLAEVDAWVRGGRLDPKNTAAVRAWAAHARADRQLQKLSEAHELAFRLIDRILPIALLSSSPSEEEKAKWIRTVGVTRDTVGDNWELCPKCRHFVVYHHPSACTHSGCSCKATVAAE